MPCHNTGDVQGCLCKFYVILSGKHIIFFIHTHMPCFQVKCYKYWPSKNESLSFGYISVELIEEKIYAFFIERKLSVTNSIVCSYKNCLQCVTQILICSLYCIKLFKDFGKKFIQRQICIHHKKRIHLCCSSACSIFRFKNHFL